MINETISVLMKRDNLTEEEATERFKETRIQIYRAITDSAIDEVEDILAMELGLELDYIFDFI